MKKALVVFLCLVVVETAVALIAMRVSSDVAALAVGAIVGILFAGLLALITALVRDERDMRQRRDAQRRARTPERVEEQGWVMDGEWREVGQRRQRITGTDERMAERRRDRGIAQPAQAGQIEAPERALVVRR